MNAPAAAAGDDTPERVGRYRIERRIGRGGMGEVYLGTTLGDGGFSRQVALKRLKRDLAQRPAFVSMLLDEARLAAAIRSPHVVATIDVVQDRGEFYVVMEYVEGHSLDDLVLGPDRVLHVPPPVAAHLVVGLLRGLGAAHDACGADGAPLHLVHRDVSPHNVLVGKDGLVRVIDFGVAKARVRLQTTQTGEVKGKPSYMAPEQLLSLDVDRRADLFAAGAIFWEMLTGVRFRANERLLARTGDGAMAQAPSAIGATAAYDAVLRIALDVTPDRRFPDAPAMIAAIEAAGPVATITDVRAWIDRALVGGGLSETTTSFDILVEHASRLEAESGIATRTELAANETSTTPMKRKRSRAPMVVAVIAALGAGSVIAWRFDRATPARTEPTASTTPSVEPPPSASASASVATTAPPPSASAATPAAEASIAGRRHRKPPPPPRVIVSVTAAPTAEAPKPDCREPFVVLADGTKVPRRECFP